MGDRRGALQSSLVVVALALVVVLVALGSSASAAVVGLERVVVTSAAYSLDKGVTATCPTGKQVVGAGGNVSPGNGHVLIESIRPDDDLTSVGVYALEDETGTDANWYVQAFAICAYPPAGLVRVSAPSAFSSAAKGVTATCPSGKRLLGTGGDINGTNGQVLLDRILPNSALTSASVGAFEDQTGNSADWSLTAYAICANPVQGLVRVPATSASHSGSPKSINALCPAGKQVTGVGGDINTTNGQVVLDSVFPATAGLTGAGLAAFEDDTGNSANWSLIAYAICANSAQRAVATSASNSNDSRSTSANCPAGNQATGVGGDITGGIGQVVLDDLIPSPTGASVAGFEDGTGTLSTWFLRAYAICTTALPDPVERLSASSASNSVGNKGTFVPCPAGKRVLGAGGAISRGTGEVVMDDIVPSADLTSARVFAREDASYTGNWSVRAYAVCANPPPGLQLVAASSESDSEEFKGVTAACPVGKNLLGTGGEIGGSNQIPLEVIMDDLRPNAALTNVTVTGIEDEDGKDSDWDVTAYAICAND